MGAVAAAEPLVDLDYAVAVDAATLDEVALIEDPDAVRLLVAAVVGPVRLIDNSAALDGADAPDSPPDPTHTVHDTPAAAAPVRQLERIG